MHTLLSLNIREAFYRRQTSNKLMFMGEGRAFNHGCHNKSKEVMPFPTRFQHLCVFSIKSKRVEPIFTAPQNITENWLSSKSREGDPYYQYEIGSSCIFPNASVGPFSRIIKSIFPSFMFVDLGIHSLFWSHEKWRFEPSEFQTADIILHSIG